MEALQHTPTPWEHLPDEEGSPIVRDGHRICDMDCRSFSDDESFESQTAQMEADAAFIVHACNLFDELKAALKSAKERVEELDADVARLEGVPGSSTFTLMVINDALAKAEGR